MPKAIRTANARAAAEAYAPTPNGSATTYGLVSSALVLVAFIAAGAFYRIDVFSSLWPIGSALLLAFVIGAALRFRRRHAHEQAFSAEYDIRSTDAPPAEPGDGPVAGANLGEANAAAHAPKPARTDTPG